MGSPGNILGIEQSGFVKSVGFDITIEKIKKILSVLKIKKFSLIKDLGYIEFSEETDGEVIKILTKELNPVKVDAYGVYFEINQEELEKFSYIFENTLKSVKIE